MSEVLTKEAVVDFPSALRDNTPAAPGSQPGKVSITGYKGVESNVNSDIQSNAFEPEDSFTGYYLGGAGTNGNGSIMQPPYDLMALDYLTQESNSLNPAIEAMVTNVAGTGFEFIRDDMKVEDQDKDPINLELWEFFREPWPGESFTQQRKKLERDRRRTGNAYLEFIRNPKGDIMFSRVMDSKLTRLVKLDEAVSVSKTIRRRGKDITMKVQVRERRYAQLLGTKLVYFKEFGSDRDLDKFSGLWAKKGERLPFNKRATEVLHFIDLPDAKSPYGVPAWISQSPSIVGSRKAEEFNNEFFDNGGVPPVMIFIQGGILGSQTKRAIENGTGGLAKTKNRVVVVETEPNGGSLDSPSKVTVNVERFGDRQEDAMFQQYDKDCEIRVRRAFRIPDLFVGGGTGQSFASAYTAITITEAQVFKPEREEFDEVISLRVLPALDARYRGWRMRSLAMNTEDSAQRLKAIETAMKTRHVEPKDVVREINETSGTSFKVTSSPVTAYDKPEADTGQNKRLPGQAADKNSGTPSAAQPATLKEE